jgi:hypothetical protein
VVAPADPGRLVGGGEQRLELELGEQRDQFVIVALGRDGQDALDRGGVLGVAQRGVAKQRADRRQARVAGADRVAALVFEVIQERADQRRLEVVDVESAGRLDGVLRGECQQQPDRVAVRCDRVRAGVLLAGQPVGEKGLQRRCQKAHRAPSSARWSWSAASASSSGAADVRIDDCATIASGVTVSGSCHIAEGAYIGTGVCLHEGITVGEPAMVGMVAVVTRDVPSERLWFGAPPPGRVPGAAAGPATMGGDRGPACGGRADGRGA